MSITEKTVEEIRRKTRRKHSTEKKVRIVPYALGVFLERHKSLSRAL